MFGRQKSTVTLIIKSAFEEARRRGVDPAAARAALDELDRAALRMLGLDAGDVPKTPRKHPRAPDTALTSSARAVLNQAIKATTMKTREAETPRHLALGLLALAHPDPAAQVIDRLGIDRAAARGRLT
ncbi:hypothetical protein FE391_23660 [Nonomuraea sp. KC401]|uniref:hypothetical protein n=1 Tax=unclassified Nonomuraea TaxID=2593643 RepID=UPI0010FEA505|nr:MULTISPECIES: hypothetical protein [unclassified Nonomuraea]NBE96683.1 hypothetical protein [Nonomuraea sp. K271]TLF67955.1 hypothetical protein FE391_23660 [Nonomuraea sp. KC401]